MSTTMSRKDFLKLTGLGLLGVFLVTKVPLKASAASPTTNNANVITDNLNGDAIHRSPTPPANTNLLWHYTGTADYTVTSNLAPGYKYIAPGTLCYYDSGWKAVTATWA